MRLLRRFAPRNDKGGVRLLRFARNDNMVARNDNRTILFVIARSEGEARATKQSRIPLLNL